ncbi:isocitrate lyase/PEP mutase family protein [Enhydrobacter sp.]|jgi:carboxyvinyl-carboxyphosphonate phosphorylmutase|uniref:isocitrate lyase/PEP mutase family protein n=1 Tax=Enhydrobacter sp. TaxID=1894999 RepID=UPI00260805FB|nr:isocitrate lyase/PEP mutase family protein [Enhydrobacter sp.]WIM11487.1 MAG: Oxaloacetate decarboxylase [Enhydrobacter sp.]
MHWTDRRKRFRAVLAAERCIHPASVHDAISARIAEDLGFEIGMFAGSVASMAVLGAPDLIVLTLSEFASQAYRINRAGNLPLLVDADHGYGNALGVKRTVEELETAGVSALSIEDTELPQPFGATRPRLVSLAEGVGKMKAALAGRQDPTLCIAGRTSAVQINGLDDAIARGKAYEQAGVDALFFVGLRTRAELDAISSATTLPLVLGSASGELADPSYLAARRVRVALQGHQPFAAAVKAVHDTLKALREGTSPAKLAGIADVELMKRVTRDADYAGWTKAFLS